MRKLTFSAGLLAVMIVAAPAHAGVIIVAAGAPVADLDVESVRRIFLGRDAVLAGQPIAVVMHKGGDLRATFDEQVLGRPGAQLTSYWAKLVFTGKAKAPTELAGDAEVRARVAATPGAIGYVDDSAVDSSVRVVFRF